MDGNKKIFISHSSKDKPIVDQFVDKILRLGLNIDINTIAYTSREDTGVINGENISQYIKNNIANCEFVFFFISENYKRSEVCLNEMGAAWATDRSVKLMLFPNLSFKSIGWLYNLNKGAHLDNEEALDSLYDDIVEKLNFKAKASSWNRYKKEFIGYIKSTVKQISNIPALIDIVQEDEDLGILDYRELFDEQNSILINTLNTLTEATVIYADSLVKRTDQLNTYSNNPYAISQCKAIMKALANDYNKMADVIDNQEPLIKSSFSNMVDHSIKIHNVGINNPQIENENRIAFLEMITAINKCKQSILDQKRVLASTTHLESSQIKAQKRLIKCYEKLIATFDACLIKSNELTSL